MQLTIPATYQDAFRVFLAKLNKKATKQGLENLTASFGPVYETEQILINNLGRDEKLTVEVLDVTLSSHVPTFKGWSFLARVESLDSNENIFHGKFDLAIPNKFKHSGSACEHCNRNRRRNNSYLLVSDTQKFIQVGSTCINDFLGNDKALNVFKFQDYIFEQIEEFEKEARESNGKSLLCVETVLAYSVREIALHGFVKSSGNDCTVVSTANLVANSMREIKIEPTEADCKKALEIKSYFASLTDTEGNDYLTKLSALCRASSCDVRNLAILVSAVNAFERVERDKQTFKPESKHVGNIKDKLELELTVKSLYTLPDYGYGESLLITFADSLGNVYLWKSSTMPDLEKGQAVKLKGTVKEHSEYKGTKQTVLTRCKFI
jgi:hypothetical protein